MVREERGKWNTTDKKKWKYSNVTISNGKRENSRWVIIEGEVDKYLFAS